jgi:hypothetical protein
MDSEADNVCHEIPSSIGMYREILTPTKIITTAVADIQRRLWNARLRL